MRRISLIFVGLTILVILLGACVPQSYVSPIEIHMNPGDYIKDARIAVDGEGRSHITGVVDDRVVYYRTRLGQKDPLSFTMTIPECSIANCKQYDPDIAVTDNGTAYIVWVEQRGGPEKFACWRSLTLVPPIGGYTTYCNPLDGTNQTTGNNVRVVGRGDVVYAVYDRIDPSGRVADWWYKNLTTATSGRIVWYSESLESGFIHSFDMAIDSSGNLHVVYIDNNGYSPYIPRLVYRSNVSTLLDNQMDQVWVIVLSATGIEKDLTSISFYKVGSVERVAMASVFQVSYLDDIYVYTCVAAGCAYGTHESNLVSLPTEWNTESIITDVKIVGIDTNLSISFIGKTTTHAAAQVWYKGAFSSTDPSNVSEDTSTLKYELHMTKLDAPPNSWGVKGFSVMGWMESNWVTAQYYVYDGLFYKSKVFDTNCLTNYGIGNLASNGYNIAAVWDICSNTWFTTRAYLSNLPLILK